MTPEMASPDQRLAGIRHLHSDAPCPACFCAWDLADSARIHVKIAQEHDRVAARLETRARSRKRLEDAAAWRDMAGYEWAVVRGYSEAARLALAEEHGTSWPHSPKDMRKPFTRASAEKMLTDIDRALPEGQRS